MISQMIHFLIILPNLQFCHLFYYDVNFLIFPLYFKKIHQDLNSYYLMIIILLYYYNGFLSASSISSIFSGPVVHYLKNQLLQLLCGIYHSLHTHFKHYPWTQNLQICFQNINTNYAYALLVKFNDVEKIENDVLKQP